MDTSKATLLDGDPLRALALHHPWTGLLVSSECQGFKKLRCQNQLTISRQTVPTIYILFNVTCSCPPPPPVAALLLDERRPLHFNKNISVNIFAIENTDIHDLQTSETQPITLITVMLF